MSVHSDFILAPVSNILCDTSTITQSMSWGIEMYPLWDNIMQSIFMKMTGAQEQKMKCICWEIATIDFDLRRDIYFSWNLNECSQITDKRKVLNFLRRAILKQKKDFNFSTIASMIYGIVQKISCMNFMQTRTTWDFVKESIKSMRKFSIV